MFKPSFSEEIKLWNQGFNLIAGVDEVGRGCFAGPVVAATVILSQNFSAVNEVNDSKLLSPLKRNKLSTIIKQEAIDYAIAEISVTIINEVGIGKATQQAFKLAIQKLKRKPEFILIDAFFIEGLEKSKQKPIIHGDRLSTSIAAASIIAKVYRDEIMQQIHYQYLNYDFYTNKGYGTQKHREAIRKFGLCKLHRTSFNLFKYI